MSNSIHYGDGVLQSEIPQHSEHHPCPCCPKHPRSLTCPPRGPNPATQPSNFLKLPYNIHQHQHQHSSLSPSLPPSVPTSQRATQLRKRRKVPRHNEPQQSCGGDGELTGVGRGCNPGRSSLIISLVPVVFACSSPLPALCREEGW